jgi:drug/metabolite transporter (DMT)-like permease
MGFLLSPILLVERPSSPRAYVLLAAMAGAGIILLGDGDTNVAGMATALVSVSGLRHADRVLRKLRGVGAGFLVCMNCLGSAVLLIPAVAYFGSFSLTGGQLVLIALLGIVQVAVPYTLFSWALRHIEAHRAALILLLEVGLNPVLTYLTVGEEVSTATLVGGPLILLSVVGWLGLGQLRAAPAKANAER